MQEEGQRREEEYLATKPSPFGFCQWLRGGALLVVGHTKLLTLRDLKWLVRAEAGQPQGVPVFSQGSHLQALLP